MGFEKQIRNKIEKAVKSFGNINVFAKACGVDHATLARYLKGEQRGLGFTSLIKIIDYMEATMPISFLSSEAKEGETASIVPLGETPDGSAGSIVPVYQFAAGGPPLEWNEVEPICEVCIPQKFMFPGLMVVQVVGDSMAPLIKDGAYVGINKHATRLVPGKVYAVSVPYEGLTIKRVFLNIDKGELLLKPENPIHPEQHVSIEDRDGLIIGQVVWGMQGI